MLRLAINTASSKTEVALYDKSGVFNREIWLSSNNEAEKLLPTIKEMLGDRDFKEIEEVFVVKGPGSFTGVRVGVTVANTIAYLNKARLGAIDTLQYWWELFMREEKWQDYVQNTALAIFAGSKGLYITTFNENQEYEKNAEIVNIEEVGGYLENLGIKKVFGDITPEQKAKLGDVEFLEVSQGVGDIAVDKAGSMDEKIIAPIYIKPPAITKKKTKF